MKNVQLWYNVGECEDKLSAFYAKFVVETNVVLYIATAVVNIRTNNARSRSTLYLHKTMYTYFTYIFVVLYQVEDRHSISLVVYLHWILVQSLITIHNETYWIFKCYPYHYTFFSRIDFDIIFYKYEAYYFRNAIYFHLFDSCTPLMIVRASKNSGTYKRSVGGSVHLKIQQFEHCPLAGEVTLTQASQRCGAAPAKCRGDGTSADKACAAASASELVRRSLVSP